MATYFQQENSARAAAYIRETQQPIGCTAASRYEFVQAAWLEAFWFGSGVRRGYSETEVLNALAAFENDVDSGLMVPLRCDWEGTFAKAETLAVQHTLRLGVRSFDILHVATALHLGAREFLTFDAPQRRLAEAEGLIVPL